MNGVVMTKTRSTEEAMTLLEATRSARLAKAREMAVTLCQENGQTHSRAVRARMAELGLLDEDESEKEFWLGSVFRDPRFVPTGEKFTYSDPARNIHEREVNVWKLGPGFYLPKETQKVAKANPLLKEIQKAEKEVLDAEEALNTAMNVDVFAEFDESLNQRLKAARERLRAVKAKVHE